MALLRHQPRPTDSPELAYRLTGWGQMNRGFAYFYTLGGDAGHIARVAPSHSRYRDETEATRAVAADPFIREGIVAQHWLRPWDQIDAQTEAELSLAV